MGEQGFDFVLIVNALRGSAFFYLDCTLESLRQLGLISGSCLLQ